MRAADTRAAAKSGALAARVASAPPAVPIVASQARFDVIAEVKLASPSLGKLGLTSSPAEITTLASSYERFGAAAISVLTEPSRFAGELTHLELVAESVAIPVMRKDFLVDPIQVLEARAAGASGVLLIARILPANLLEEMTDLALSLDMFALIEVFDRSDLETAAVVFDRDVLVGVNSRDLTSLEVDDRRFEALAPHLPDGRHAVAESGVGTAADVRELVTHGYNMALVGSSLVQAADPGTALRHLLSAGRLEEEARLS